LRHIGAATFLENVNSCFVIVCMCAVSRRIKFNRRLDCLAVVGVLSRIVGVFLHSAFLLIDRMTGVLFSASPNIVTSSRVTPCTVGHYDCLVS